MGLRKGISVPVVVYRLHLHLEGTSKCLNLGMEGVTEVGFKGASRFYEVMFYALVSALSVITSQFCETKQYVGSVHGCCVKICAN